MKKRLNSNSILNFVAVFILIALIAYLVSAAASYNSATLNAPVSGGNYSAKDLLTFNCSVRYINFSSAKPVNVSLWVNKTGGNAWNGSIVNVSVTTNTSDLQIAYQNASINFSGLTGDILPDGKNYNFTCKGDNGTYFEFSGAAGNITIDSSPPNATTLSVNTNTTGEGNYSGVGGLLTLNVSVDDVTIGRDSVYFNITNSTGTQVLMSSRAYNHTSLLFNASINVSSLTTGLHNATVWANDSLNNINRSKYLMIYIDNLGPATSSLYSSNLTAGKNVSGYTTTLYEINTSVEDARLPLDSVYFNISSTAGVQYNWTRAFNNSNLTEFNATINTTYLADGQYYITSYTNDSLGNLNKTSMILVRFDNTAPSIDSLTKTSSSTNSITLAVAITESGSGVQACTCDRTTASVTGGGNAWTITESPLQGGTSYTYSVTCTDYAGLTSGLLSITTSTETGSGTTTGGGGGARGTTYTVSKEQFEEGYTKAIGTSDKIKVSVSSVDHQISVSTVTSTTATITISSTPQTATLSVGDTRKFEVTGDTFYDMSVKLNSIANNKASLTVKSIHEEITAETTAEEEEKEAAAGEVKEEELAKGKNLVWIILIIAVVVIAIIAYIVYKKKRYY